MPKSKKKSEATSPTKSDDEKPKVGRPTDYRPEYCDMVVAWGKEGKSFLGMACELGASRRVLNQWADAHPAFMQALEEAKEHWQHIEVERARSHLIETKDGAKLNTALYKFHMASWFREDFSEHATVQVNATGNNSAVEVNFGSSDKPPE